MNTNDKIIQALESLLAEALSEVEASDGEAWDRGFAGGVSTALDNVKDVVAEADAEVEKHRNIMKSLQKLCLGGGAPISKLGDAKHARECVE